MTGFLILLRRSFPVSIWTTRWIPSPSCSTGHYKNCTATFTFQPCSLLKIHSIFNPFLSISKVQKSNQEVFCSKAVVSTWVWWPQRSKSNTAFMWLSFKTHLIPSIVKKKKSPSNQKFGFPCQLFFAPLSSLVIFHLLPLRRFQEQLAPYLSSQTNTTKDRSDSCDEKRIEVTGHQEPLSWRPSWSNPPLPQGFVRRCFTQPPLSKCASSAWLLLTDPLRSPTCSLLKLFPHAYPHVTQPLQVMGDHRWQRPSPHTMCHRGHLTLQQAAEDAELQVSREAPGFASVPVSRATKTDAENTNI